MRKAYFVAALMLPLAFSAPTPSPEPIKLEFRGTGRLSPTAGNFNGHRFLTHLNNTLAKYNAEELLPTYERLGKGTLARRATGKSGKEPLVDQTSSEEDILYYGSGIVGTSNPQTFTFDFDTGSADIFVPGPKCGSAQGCPHTTKYNSGGKDQKRTTSVSYGSGSVSGEDYVDSVSVAGLTATGQGLISLNTAAGFSGISADGLMGMAFSKIASSKFPTFFENLMTQKKVAAPEFSFYLGRTASQTSANSELTLGGRNTAKFSGTIVQVPVTTPGYWQVAIQGAKIGHNPVNASTKGQAAIDTGTTLIIAPKVAAAAIFAQVPGAYPISTTTSTIYYAYPCNTVAQNIPALVFAGWELPINPLDFNYGQLTTDFAADIENSDLAESLASSSTAMCTAGIVGANLGPGGDLWVVGDTFLKSWYSIFNYSNAKGGKPSVSFAESI